jgi:GNAT superfamily N-acetyltransferase
MEAQAVPRDDLRIRRATPDDAPAIATIRVAGWQSAYRGQLEDALLDRLSATKDEPRWRAHLEAPPPGHRGFVAERSGETVGFATCGPTRDPGQPAHVGELYAIYVVPRAAGTGVGRALLQRALDALREDGYAEATLWVLESNRRGHAFYEASGWRRDGATKQDLMDGFELREVRYRVRLAGAAS